MAAASSAAAAVAALGRLVDRTRVPDPTLQRHAVAAAVAALVSRALRSGLRFPPHDHPFVQALASGCGGARAELPRQAARMVAEGVSGVLGFLRPFVMFAAVRKGDAAFVKDLIGALAAAAVAAPNSDSTVPVLKLLAECLLHFGRGDGEEMRLWLSSVECLVDAYVVLLRKLAHAQMTTYDAQASSVELIEMLLSQCSFHHQLMGTACAALGLSKHLLLVQKDLGLCYLPEISVVLSSLAFILSGLEFEHEQLAGLKLLTFLIEWRHENALRTNEAVHYFREEILCVLPVINLVMSPSKSVKSVASHVLSRLHLLVLDLLAPCSSEQHDSSFVHHISKPATILPKLVHHLWSQSSPSGFMFTKYITSRGLPESAGNLTEANYWTNQINEHLSALHKEKLTLDSLSSKKIPSVATSLLVSSAVSVLVMHPKLGTSAAQSLALLGATDPTLGMPLLVLILFYTKVLYSDNDHITNILLSLLESLPSFAVHGFVLPVALQLISTMLNKDVKPVLYAIAVRLLCKMWTFTDWAFQTLQGILDPENISNFIDDREVITSIAASVRDVCKQNPDRGVDLILSVSASIESRDSVVQALGLESLSYLCEADVVDFYTAWKVISKQLLDFSIDPTVSHGLCILLRWGAMDAEAYPGTSKHLIQTLWSIGTYREKNANPLWVKARGTAFRSLSHYKISLIKDAIPDFGRINYEYFINERNLEVLKAMESFQAESIKFEHINRHRLTTDKTTTTVHKFEKLLDAFPQAVFKGKSGYHRLPGAALLTLNFTPKDILHEGKSKDLHRVHAAYEQALVEMAESMYISRNMVLALLALHSWKSFVSNWMQAVIACLDTKESTKSNKASKAADDIFKILCKCVPISTPRVVVNIALAIGALCLVVPPTAHLVISSASDFLLRWLFQYEHEHQQWSAALSLGLISNCFHPTDKRSKLQVINGLLEVISKTESYLVKGACGLGLGYSCQVLLARADNTTDLDLEATSKLTERASFEEILHTLTTSLVQLCPLSCYSLKKLNICGIRSLEGMEEKYISLDDDPWAVAGLVLGLGNSVVSLYRLGASEAVIDVKNILISWIPDVDSSSVLFDENDSALLCMGSCLALPSVVAFCQKVELLNDDLDALFNRYTSLATELLRLKKSGTIFQNLLMAICIGAGSFLSCILNDGVHAMKFTDVKNLLDTLKHIYTHPYPPLVHLGGILGAVNAFGAGAGDLTGIPWQPTKSEIKHEKESSLVRGPLLTSPVGETLSTSMIQEIFLLAKDAEDDQMQNYAAWSISFLRSRWLLKNQNICDDDCSQSSSDSNQSTSFSNESLVWNLSLWLKDLNFEKPDNMVSASTIATVLGCLSKAPRLPAIDWGVIVRRCMKVEAHISDKLTNHHDHKLLREESLYFSLAHASHISPLLHFIDDLTDLPRFRRLEINLQSILLQYLSHLMKLFSHSRLDKFYEDLTEYLYSPTSSYLEYSSEQRSMLRTSFWKGIRECLVEDVSEESSGFSCIKKCIHNLLHLLSLHKDGQPEFIEEWSAAIKCLTVAKKSLLGDTLQVEISSSFSEVERIDVSKNIMIRARMCSSGCGSADELGNIKTTILSTRLDGVWWNVLVEVATAVYSADSRMKKQWLLDALDIGCVTAHPSTVLHFVGLLCGSCCIYMPLLIVNPTNVLSDLPVTLPSFLSSSICDDHRNSVADKLWLLTTRIYAWAEQSTQDACHDLIHESEADKANFLANILRCTCIAVEDHLAVEKKLKLANLEAL
uniref:DUF3730 domain-containing protein n=1 Tax=Leersia perrieri TaxID=77586 RepID=A0A0D9UX89_9ORYZ